MTVDYSATTPLSGRKGNDTGIENIYGALCNPRVAGGQGECDRTTGIEQYRYYGSEEAVICEASRKKKEHE